MLSLAQQLVVEHSSRQSDTLPLHCSPPACTLACPGLQVELGWTCTPTSPSVCTQGGGEAHPHGIPSDPHIGPDAPPSGGGGGGGAPQPKRHRSGWVVAVVVLAAVGAAMAVAFAARERIFDNFPQAGLIVRLAYGLSTLFGCCRFLSAAGQIGRWRGSCDPSQA